MSKNGLCRELVPLPLLDWKDVQISFLAKATVQTATKFQKNWVRYIGVVDTRFTNASSGSNEAITLSKGSDKGCSWSCGHKLCKIKLYVNDYIAITWPTLQ